jgi:hypothetical protein
MLFDSFIRKEAEGEKKEIFSTDDRRDLNKVIEKEDENNLKTNRKR